MNCFYLSRKLMFTRPALLATCPMNQPYFCRVNNRVAMESYLLIFLFLFVICCSSAIIFLCKWKLQKTTKQASEQANFAKRQEQELEQVKIVSKLCKGKSKKESSECHCTIFVYVVKCLLYFRGARALVLIIIFIMLLRNRHIPPVQNLL